MALVHHYRIRRPRSFLQKIRVSWVGVGIILDHQILLGPFPWGPKANRMLKKLQALLERLRFRVEGHLKGRVPAEDPLRVGIENLAARILEANCTARPAEIVFRNVVIERGLGVDGGDLEFGQRRGSLRPAE